MCFWCRPRKDKIINDKYEAPEVVGFVVSLGHLPRFSASYRAIPSDAARPQGYITLKSKSVFTNILSGKKKRKFVFLSHPTPCKPPLASIAIQIRGGGLFAVGGTAKQTLVSPKSKSLSSSSWSSCRPGSLNEQDDRTSRTRFDKLSFLSVAILAQET